MLPQIEEYIPYLNKLNSIEFTTDGKEWIEATLVGIDLESNLVKLKTERHLHWQKIKFQLNKNFPEIPLVRIKEPNPNLSDDTVNPEVNNAIQKILQISSEMMKNGISEDICDWKLPETTPISTKRKIVRGAEKYNARNINMARRLSFIYKVLIKAYPPPITICKGCQKNPIEKPNYCPACLDKLNK